MIPRVWYVLYVQTLCPCLLDADWCLQSDAVPVSLLQVPRRDRYPGGVEDVARAANNFDIAFFLRHFFCGRGQFAPISQLRPTPHPPRIRPTHAV